LIGCPILLAAVIGFYLRFPPGPTPICNRQIDGALMMWMQDRKTNAYPNVRGEQTASLAEAQQFFSRNGELHRGYGYVPGLRPRDPDSLIFMYLKQKTRREWHGDLLGKSIFTRPQWLVISPGIMTGPCVEGSELLDTAEFKKRLLATLEFLKDDNRSYWQTVVKEQTAFLDSIRE
jgi:hypothetical protein